jgi:predicted nucleic acid-binding protein
VKIVLDASVAVASERASEPHHRRARLAIDRLLRGDDEILVPAIFMPEVVAALARRGHDANAAERFALALIGPSTNVVTIGPRRAIAIARFAARHRLRGADACYAWIAALRGLPLVTLDEEMIRRAPGVVARLP